MEIEGDYSRGLIEKFLNRISLKELKKVDAIHLTLNPMKPDMPRHLQLVSQESISNWDPQWRTLNCKDSIPQKLLDQKTLQKKIVQDYYKENKDLFEDISCLMSQIQIENATGVHGGSLLLYSQGSYGEVKNDLAIIFLHLARALNRGHFDVDSTFTVSLKIFPENRRCCVKLDMTDSSCQINEVLGNIQHVLERQRCGSYNLELKTHVACYLAKLEEIEESRIHFEPPIRGTTDAIDEISQILYDLQL